MTSYYPTGWSLIKVEQPGHDTFYKIFGSWEGSYLHGASWKLSSGVETLEEIDRGYTSKQSSGSVYEFKPSGEGRHPGYCLSVLDSIFKSAQEAGVKFSIVGIDDYMKGK